MLYKASISKTHTNDQTRQWAISAQKTASTEDRESFNKGIQLSESAISAEQSARTFAQSGGGSYSQSVLGLGDSFAKSHFNGDVEKASNYVANKLMASGVTQGSANQQSGRMQYTGPGKRGAAFVAAAMASGNANQLAALGSLVNEAQAGAGAPVDASGGCIIQPPQAGEATGGCMILIQQLVKRHD